MVTALSQSTRLESIWQLFTITVIFLVVLAVTYYTTKLIAKLQKNNVYNRNIEVIETYKLTANKYIQIVKTGDKYLVIAIAKDSVTMLTELNGDQLEILNTGTDTTGDTQSFSDIFNKLKDLKQKTDSKK